MALGRRRRTDPGNAVESLGSVTCPSGDVFVFDFGLLRLWSGDRPPVLDGDVVPPEVAAQANASDDFEISGRDAVTVAAALDLAAVKGRYAFDLPDHGESLSERVATICQERSLHARVQRIGRMPHRRRLERLLDDDPTGAEVPFHGVWGVAVRGVPRSRSLPVLGRRMDDDGPDAGRWHSVWVLCDERPPVSSIEAGYVLVDEARLMFADPRALDLWRNDEALDGLADLEFWGRDAVAAADVTGASPVDASQSNVFGWLDRPVAEVVRLARQLEELRSDAALKFVIDFRPHDHHHQMLRLARTTPTEAGTITLDGFLVTGLFTTWGDGAFPVYRDVAADGSLCRIRVELGAPEIVQRTRRFEELWFGSFPRWRSPRRGSPTTVSPSGGCTERRPIGTRTAAGGCSPAMRRRSTSMTPPTPSSSRCVS
ncbi:MAG TPA: hypothetical protein VK975_04470 [Acidimicrobiales bacterium]|nr:hypothetical protein [Acidimicrobiales bacterium]